MIKFVITLTTIVLTLVMSSCKMDFDLDSGIDGNGNVKTEPRTLSEPFTKVLVKRGLEVILEQNETVFVEVETDENLLKHITTTVENGTLIVTSDENIDESDARIVRVKMPSIESLETTSGSSLKTKNTIRGINLSVKSSSGSDLTATVEYEKVHAESTSGSDLTLSGKALKLESASSSGSQINADKLLTNEVNAQATSGSSTDVNALVRIDGKASSGASINFDGNAKEVKNEESSGGSVSGN